MTTFEIRRVAESDAGAAAAVLARAFLDEPIFIAAVPDASDRERLCGPLFMANVRHACRYGEVLAVGERSGPPLGVAYWVARPEPRLSAETVTDLGFTALAEAWGPKLARLGDLEAEAARSLDGLREPWRYLGAIGVDPDRQGQGLGSLLLGRIIADATAAGAVVALVTDRSRNVPFYTRAGMEIVAEGVSASDGFPWWSFATAIR